MSLIKEVTLRNKTFADFYRLAYRSVNTIIAMSGLRLDFGQIPLRILLLALGSGIIWAPIFLLFKETEHRAVAGAVLCWLYYYGGMSLIFRSSISKAWIARCGEEAAYRWLTVLVGIGFLNQSLAQTVVISAFENTLHFGVWGTPMKMAGFALIIIGFTTKIWATLLTGLDTYYYKDLFVRHIIRHENSADGYITTGPYRYFSNPMYGVGNFQAYGAALVAFSFEGLLVAGIYQATIYLFYFLVEKPFFVRAYITKETHLPCI